jgi:hypothetical protein
VCMSYAHRLLDSLGMGVLKRGLNQRGSPRDAYEMCDVSMRMSSDLKARKHARGCSRSRGGVRRSHVVGELAGSL